MRTSKSSSASPAHSLWFNEPSACSSLFQSKWAIHGTREMSQSKWDFRDQERKMEAIEVHWTSAGLDAAACNGNMQGVVILHCHCCISVRWVTSNFVVWAIQKGYINKWNFKTQAVKVNNKFIQLNPIDVLSKMSCTETSEILASPVVNITRMSTEELSSLMTYCIQMHSRLLTK